MGTLERRLPVGEGTQDKAEGKLENLKGDVKEKVGDATDNEQWQAEGKADQVKGKGQEAWGGVKDAAQDAKEGVKEAFDRDK